MMLPQLKSNEVQCGVLLDQGNGGVQSRAPLPGNTGPERQLILACARTSIDKQHAERIRSLLHCEIDWDYVVRKAQGHCVAPLVFRSLDRFCDDLVPPQVLDDLRTFCQANTRSNLSRTKEMLRLLKLLDTSGITAVPFKGPLLAFTAYGDLGLRQFTDLDLLVRRRDLRGAKNKLLAEGYRLVPRSWIQKRFPLLSRRKDLIFVKDRAQIKIELHWKLSGDHFRFAINRRLLWQQLEEEHLANAKVHSLPVEDLLIYLCVHGSRHSWQRLGWICDVAQIIRTNRELDLNQLIDRAIGLQAERMVFLGLLLAHNLLSVDLPPQVKARVNADAQAVETAASIERLLFQDDRTIFSDIGYWYKHHLAVRNTFGDRLRLHLYYFRRYFLLTVTPNARDRAMLAVPKPLSFIYYALRPIRLTAVYGPPAIKRLVS